MLNETKSAKNAIKAKGYSIVTIYDPSMEDITVQLEKAGQISYRVIDSEEKCSEALVKFLRILEK